MRTLVVLATVALVGCSTTDLLRGRSEDAIGAAVNPEQREFHYIRDGNVIHYFRRECSGDFCDKPE